MTGIGLPAARASVGFDEQTSEAELVAAARGGHTAAYERIMQRHNQRLFRVARSVMNNDADAEDVLQDAWVKAFRNLHRYTDDGRLGAWLSRITVNEGLMKKRRLERQTAHSETVESLARRRQRNQSVSPEAEASNGELRMVLQRAVDTLPAKFRSVFVLRAVEQLSVDETARSLDIPEATVKTRYFRARRLLREQISAEMEISGTQLYEFAGERCQRLAENVLQRLGS